MGSVRHSAFNDAQMGEAFDKCENRLRFLMRKVASIFRDFREMNLWNRLLNIDCMRQISLENDNFKDRVARMEDEIRVKLNEWESLFNGRNKFSFEFNLRLKCSEMNEAILKNLVELKKEIMKFMRQYTSQYEMIKFLISSSPFKGLSANDNVTHWLNTREYKIRDGTIEISDDDDDCVFLGYVDFPEKVFLK